MKTGTYPRTRSLIKLLRLLSNISGGLDILFEGRNIVMLTKIEDAYIGARYLARRYGGSAKIRIGGIYECH